MEQEREYAKLYEPSNQKADVPHKKLESSACICMNTEKQIVFNTSTKRDTKSIWNIPCSSSITQNEFNFDESSMSVYQHEMALKKMSEITEKYKTHMLGYQVNQKESYQNALGEYLNCHLNNAGDPFSTGNYSLNTKEVEKAVLDYYAKLWNLQNPTNPQREYWGYILSMGSTEGNLCGLWNGRDYLSGIQLKRQEVYVNRINRVPTIPCQQHNKENKNCYTPIALYSQDTHYSVIKLMQVLKIDTFYEIGTKYYPHECPLKAEDYPSNYDIPSGWPKQVPSNFSEIDNDKSSNRCKHQDYCNFDGSIYIPALIKLVDFFARKGYPILICFNYGSTFKGAYDRVHDAVKALIPVFIKHDMYERRIAYVDSKSGSTYIEKRNGFWIHVDGALGAAYMPYLEKKNIQIPAFDFRRYSNVHNNKPLIHSIAMSGHKWIGSPWPSGIYMTLPEYQLLPPENPEYLGSPDTTFAGSRNALSPLIFWTYLSKRSTKDQIDKAIRLENLSRYAYRHLKTTFEDMKERKPQDIRVERTSLSLTVRFTRPHQELVQKYCLSCETVRINGEKRKYAHIYMMDHVTKELIDEFIQDLRTYEKLHEGAFYHLDKDNYHQ